MNAIDMLTKQHRGMEAALKAVLDAPDASRREQFETAADVLMSHVLIEEQHFYPAVSAQRTEDTLLESLEEHLSLKRLIADLLQLPADHSQFVPKLHVLKEQAEHHHEEEEKKLFPAVKKLLSRDQLDALGDVMLAAQKALLPRQPREKAAAQRDAAAELE
jgi:hemerythrin superfamily protein